MVKKIKEALKKIQVKNKPVTWLLEDPYKNY